MNKHTFEWHGRKYYLLGKGKDGENYYLEQGHFDCGWYWGVGYVETFTNKCCPEHSSDISSHQHFNGLFKTYTDWFDFWEESPFSKSDMWTIYELMMSIYTARHYSDMLHTGGSHFTTNPCKYTIFNEGEYKRINESLIPELLSALYGLLS